MKTVLIVGRASNGKSSVGNSILGLIPGKQRLDECIEIENETKLDHDFVTHLKEILLKRFSEKGDNSFECKEEIEMFQDLVENSYKKQVKYHEETFKVRTPSAIDTLKIELKKNKEFVVVDISGIGDTETDMAGSIEDVILQAYNAVLLTRDEFSYKNKTELRHMAKIAKIGDEIESVTGQTNVSTGEEKNNVDKEQDATTDEGNENMAGKQDAATGDGMENLIEEQDATTSEKEENVAVFKTNTTDGKDGPTHLEDHGFDAILFVLKFGGRFTKQEKDAVDMIKYLYGKNVFKDWGILVFTYGDNFDSESDKNFNDWYMEQKGELKSLLEEVQNRCVIFDNKTENSDEQSLQRSNLSTMINKVKERKGPKYTIDLFAAPLQKLDNSERYSESNKEKQECIDLERKIQEHLRNCSRSMSVTEYKYLLEFLLQTLIVNEKKRKEKCILI